MAALCELEKKGIIFDHVFGVLAGVMNAVYFLAGQSEDALAAYLNDINVLGFINPLRLNKVVNVDYLVDEIFKRRKPLAVDKITASATTLHIAVTDYEAGQPAEITNHDSGVDLFEALRATAAVPVFYGHPVSINGKRYIDGGITQNLPIQKAIDTGCTDLTIILTRPLGVPEFSVPGWLKRLALRAYPAKTRHSILEEPLRCIREMELVQKYKDSPVVRLRIIAPSDPTLMVSFTQNLRRDRLNACVKMARQDTLAALTK
jgi:predicted patatin/cPLA2 family phospholipase